MTNKKEITYLDLFAGAGGLSEGFLSSGFTPVAHVEMDEHACNTLKTRACYYYLTANGNKELYKQYLKGQISRDELYISVPKTVIDTVIRKTMKLEDMTDLFDKIDSLLNNHERKQIDLILGGPPCQAYSLVGRAVKGSEMANDPRNYLYKVYLSVLERYKPKLFVFENVPGLLNANGGKYFSDIKRTFGDAGYEIEYRILNAVDFSVLQNRKRIILIGWRKGLPIHYPCFEQLVNDACVSDILTDLPALQAGEESHIYASENYSEYLKNTEIRKPDDILTWHVARPNIERDREIYRMAIAAWNENGKRIKYTDLPERLCTHKNKAAFLDRFKVVASNLPASHTMMAHISKDGHYFIHPDINQARSITVREAARIQSFPDDYYFEGPRTAAFTQIGNAVPPLMAKGIANALKKQLEKIDE